MATRMMGLAQPQQAAIAPTGGTVYGGGSRPMSAQETFAALTRQQWDDYLRNFIPIENELINYATNPQTVADAVMNARTDVDRAFDSQQRSQARRLRGLGIDLAPDEQASVDRQTGLARSLADVSAANLTTERVRDRQQALLGNPAPNIQGV
jgi:hypothetical protein